MQTIIGRPKKNSRQDICCWGLFLLLQVLCFYMVIHHAMWRDELQTWSMVRESHSLAELFFNMRFDGTPPLWYLALWALSSLTSAPLAMQMFHFSCASLTGFLMMRRAPFPLWIRFLFVSGYYFAFEYMVISRGYILGLLLSVIYCIFSEKFSKRPYLAGLLIGLVANTTSYGAVLSIALFAMHALDLVIGLRKGAEGVGRSFLQIMLAYLPLLFIAVVFMIPAKGGNFVEAYNFTPTVLDVAATVSKILISLIPIPTPGPHFWNTLLFFDHGLMLAIPMAVFTAALVVVALRASKREMFLFFICLLGMAIFGQVIYLGYNRHGGTLMICFVVACWLAELRRVRGGVGAVENFRWSRLALTLILLANTTAFAVSVWYHGRYPFSGSKEMAEYITGHHLEKRPIVGDVDFEVSAVAGYLNTPIYYVTNGKRETFIRWNIERMEEKPFLEIERFIADIETHSGAKSLLLLSYPGDLRGYRLLHRTGPCIVEYERLYLYEKY